MPLQKVSLSMSIYNSVDDSINWGFLGPVPDASQGLVQPDPSFPSSDFNPSLDFSIASQPLNNPAMRHGSHAHSDTEVAALRSAGVEPDFSKSVVGEDGPGVVKSQMGKVEGVRKWFPAGEGKGCDECLNNGHDCFVPKSFKGQIKKCQRCSGMKQLCSLSKSFLFRVGSDWEVVSDVGMVDPPPSSPRVSNVDRASAIARRSIRPRVSKKRARVALKDVDLEVPDSDEEEGEKDWVRVSVVNEL